MSETSERTPRAHRLFDNLSGGTLLGMTVWAPWAFGCTVSWAIWILCGGGFALGLLLAGKHWVAWRSGFRPHRLVEHSGLGLWFVRGLALLTVVFLLWAFAGAVNGRATVEWGTRWPTFRYEERAPLAWLPASYDIPSSWRAAIRWTAWAMTFWAARDWLLGKSRRERHGGTETLFPPTRLRCLLWTLSISSGLLAVVGMLQRFDGTPKLLWLLLPVIPAEPSFRFGPYAYRTNAAQYFNLVWPLTIGLWWSLRERAHILDPRAKAGSQPHVVLLPIAILLASVPFITTSRGGALVAVGLFATTITVVVLQRSVRPATRGLLAGTLIMAAATGWLLGGTALQERFKTVFTDRMNGRLDLYEVGDRMAKDFVWLGSGAETFMGLNYLYRSDLEEKAAGYLHNDWLETRITLGRIGLGLASGLLLCLIGIWSTGRGKPRPPTVFTALLLSAMAGLLVHARFDFPFQIVSLQFQFLLLCAILSATAAR